MNLPSILVLLAVITAAVFSLCVYRRRGKSDCCRDGCSRCKGGCCKKRS